MIIKNYIYHEGRKYIEIHQVGNSVTVTDLRCEGGVDASGKSHSTGYVNIIVPDKEDVKSLTARHITVTHKAYICNDDGQTLQTVRIPDALTPYEETQFSESSCS